MKVNEGTEKVELSFLPSQVISYQCADTLVMMAFYQAARSIVAKSCYVIEGSGKCMMCNDVVVSFLNLTLYRLT